MGSDYAMLSHESEHVKRSHPERQPYAPPPSRVFQSATAEKAAGSRRLFAVLSIIPSGLARKQTRHKSQTTPPLSSTFLCYFLALPPVMASSSGEVQPSSQSSSSSSSSSLSAAESPASPSGPSQPSVFSSVFVSSKSHSRFLQPIESFASFFPALFPTAISSSFIQSSFECLKLSALLSATTFFSASFLWPSLSVFLSLRRCLF